MPCLEGAWMLASGIMRFKMSVFIGPQAGFPRNYAGNSLRLSLPEYHSGCSPH